MKFRSFFATAAALILTVSLSLASSEASAKRFGGGKTSGMQRQFSAPNKAPSAAPAPAGASTAAQASASPARSWMGPVAGLAAGLGIAALASHFGFGGELASMVTMFLLVTVVMMVIGYFMRRRNGAGASNGMQYAAAGSGQDQRNVFERNPLPAFGPAGANPAAAPGTGAPASGRAGHIPADFDVRDFARSAKLNFIRLQAANDAGNLDDIREFTTPEMFAEIRLSIAERGDTKQETDVVSIDATVLNVEDEGNRRVVSVRFVGLVREEANANPQPVDEVWHLVSARGGKGGWQVAGIEQLD